MKHLGLSLSFPVSFDQMLGRPRTYAGSFTGSDNLCTRPASRFSDFIFRSGGEFLKKNVQDHVGFWIRTFPHFQRFVSGFVLYVKRQKVLGVQRPRLWCHEFQCQQDLSMRPGRGTRDVGYGMELEINNIKNLIELFPNGAFHGQKEKKTVKHLMPINILFLWTSQNIGNVKLNESCFPTCRLMIVTWLNIPTGRKKADQLAIFKRGRGFELEATQKQIQVVVRAGLEPRTAGFRVRHAASLILLSLASDKFNFALSFSEGGQFTNFGLRGAWVKIVDQ